MKELIWDLLATFYFKDLAIAFLRSCRQIRRNLSGIDGRIVDDYFDSHEVRKLHIGCGENTIEGWLNSDYYPRSDKILHLNAIKPFPFNKNDFDYVFSEHIIEHINYYQGLHMLAECYRILKTGGKIRISTPNLSFLIDLYIKEKSELQKSYVAWATANLAEIPPYYKDTFLINKFVRDWGHTFIYDEKVLRYSLEKVGFTKIKKCDLNDSEDDHLMGLENEGRMPAGFLRLESIILEGIKP